MGAAGAAVELESKLLLVAALTTDIARVDLSTEVGEDGVDKTAARISI